jgi:bacterioferritin
MKNKELIDGLNRALEMDLRAIVQYMWQYVMARGEERESVRKVFRKIALQEMNHAESFAERIKYLGGVPTTSPADITVGATLREMVELDFESENESIEQCKRVIAMAVRENDPVTKLLVEKILSETEEHADSYRKLLGAK